MKIYAHFRTTVEEQIGHANHELDENFDNLQILLYQVK